MTDRPQPPMPDLPPQPEPSPEQAPAPTTPPPAQAGKGRLSNKVVIGSAAAVIAAVIGTGITVAQTMGGDSKPATTKSSSTPADDPTPTGEADEADDPDPAYVDLTADDFTVQLRTTKRQCFGTAGCNLTVEPKLTYIGLSEAIDPDGVYEITYEITGDESGPVIQTAELSDQTSLNYTPTVISTESAGTKVTVEITDVTETGV